MNPERNRDIKKAVAVTAVASGIVSGVVVVVDRELQKRRMEKLNREALEQSAGDGNYVLTPEEVRKRSGYGF